MDPDATVNLTCEAENPSTPPNRSKRLLGSVHLAHLRAAEPLRTNYGARPCINSGWLPQGSSHAKLISLHHNRRRRLGALAIYNTTIPTLAPVGLMVRRAQPRMPWLQKLHCGFAEKNRDLAPPRRSCRTNTSAATIPPPWRRRGAVAGRATLLK